MANRERDVEKEQYWRLVLEEFGASGMNVREFCRSEGLQESSFYAWRRELDQRDAKRKAGRPGSHQKNSAKAQQSTANRATPALVEVVTRPRASSQAIEIETPAGFTIRLGEQVDRQVVAAVLSSMLPLEQGSC